MLAAGAFYLVRLISFQRAGAMAVVTSPALSINTSAPLSTTCTLAARSEVPIQYSSCTVPSSACVNPDFRTTTAYSLRWWGYRRGGGRTVCAHEATAVVSRSIQDHSSVCCGEESPGCSRGKISRSSFRCGALSGCLGSTTTAVKVVSYRPDNDVGLHNSIVAPRCDTTGFTARPRVKLLCLAEPWPSCRLGLMRPSFRHVSNRRFHQCR